MAEQENGAFCKRKRQELVMAFLNLNEKRRIVPWLKALFPKAWSYSREIVIQTYVAYQCET